MNVTAFHDHLLSWYQKHGRHHLPWRQTSDPYHIWLSEIMLQQTQVERVLQHFYFPFLERFPSIEALSKATEQDVLKYWQGLGYYSRARNLHKAAQLCTPELPRTIPELLALPGVGNNTAHAIAAFAYHQPVAILEANVKRIIARIFTLRSPTDRELWEKAHDITDTGHPFDYNQAMMDLGSMVCTPKAPKCHLCPAKNICSGQEAPESYPQRKVKKQIPTRHRRIILFRDSNQRLYMEPRQTQFLNGLWMFPEIEDTDTSIEFLGEEYLLPQMQHIGTVAHSYSHFHLNAQIYVQQLISHYNSENWIDINAISALPLSRTEQKILTLLQKS